MLCFVPVICVDQFGLWFGTSTQVKGGAATLMYFFLDGTAKMLFLSSFFFFLNILTSSQLSASQSQCYGDDNPATQQYCFCSDLDGFSESAFAVNPGGSSDRSSSCIGKASQSQTCGSHTCSFWWHEGEKKSIESDDTSRLWTEKV